MALRNTPQDLATRRRRSQNPLFRQWIRLAATALAATTLAYGADVPPSKAPSNQDRAELLTMSTALGKAYRNNPTLVGRRMQQELFEINYDEAWRRMWLPSVGLNLTTGAAYTVAELPGSTAASPGGGGLQHGSPFSGAGLSLGQYNIYNFGRDADTLKSAELEVERSRETMHETERTVRFQVIQAMFTFKTRQDLLDASQRSVDAAESVYELVKGRMSGGRANRVDLSSCEIDLLNARASLLQNQTAYSQSLWDLNLALGDPIGHPYRVKSDVKFIKFRMPLDEVLAIYRENAPAVRDARKSLEQRQAELRIAEKNALPLPTVSFSGVNFGYNFTPQGTNPARDPGNWNFQVGLNLTIPLVGDGGFLFHRALRTAEVNVDLAELQVKNSANLTEVRARDLYTAILQDESAVELNQKLFKHATEFFDASLVQLQSKGGYSHLDLKSALEQLRTSELTLTSSILDHYSLKLQLAQLIGVDRFPEENL